MPEGNSSRKRSIPGKMREQQRRDIFAEYRQAQPAIPVSDSVYGLEDGNKKTGTSGRKFDKIYIWNLPPVATCPGASEWCEAHCYNLDRRSDVYPINRWRQNLWLYYNKPDALQYTIRKQLNCAAGSCAVRIHSSGDFFSREYIQFWDSIVSASPNVRFWAYTRSWIVPELAEQLEKLMANENMSLLLSYDKSMEYLPPISESKSLVFDRTEEMQDYAQNNDKGIICPEQHNMVACCADCGICMNKEKKDILFLLH